MTSELPAQAPAPAVPQKRGRKKKEPFTPEEDQKIRELVAEKGTRSWPEITEQLPGRTTRQCRERWNLYLSPEVCNDPWAPEDEAKLVQMYQILGAKWTLLARAFPNRTANNVKNKLKQCIRRAQKIAKTTEKRRLETIPVDAGVPVTILHAPPPVHDLVAPPPEAELPTEAQLQRPLPEEQA